MKELDALEKNLREELARQESLYEALMQKKESLGAGDSAKLEKSMDLLTQLAMQGEKLQQERESLLPKISSLLGLRAEILKMGDLVRALAGQEPRFVSLHDSLRQAVERTADLSRKTGQLVRHYREVYGDALNAILHAAGIEGQGIDSKNSASGIVLHVEG